MSRDQAQLIHDRQGGGDLSRSCSGDRAPRCRVWENSYQLLRDEEKRFIADSVETIQRVTGQNPIERFLDAQLHLYSGDAAGPRLSLPHRRAEPRRAVHRPSARTGFRDGPLHLPHE
jgi:hypothetical protein